MVVLTVTNSPCGTVYTFICPGTSVEFTNNSPDTTVVKWYFGDGDSSSVANPVHQYTSGGNYLVELNVTNSCGSNATVIDLVSVTSSSEAYVYIKFSNDSICIGDTVFFSSGGGDPINSYWDFDDGVKSSIDFPTHLFSNGGVHMVSLDMESVCGTASDSIEIFVAIPDTNNAPLLTCTTYSSFIIFLWYTISNVSGYEFSIDHGQTWETVDDSVSSFLVTGLNQGDTVNALIKSKSDEECVYEKVSDTLTYVTLIGGIFNTTFERSITIYPNPSNEILFIKSLILVESLTIYNNLGKALVHQSTMNNDRSLNISGLISGIYFIKVKTKRGIYIKKFSKL